MAGEDLVFVSLEDLEHFSALYIPKSCSMIKTCGEDLGALRVEYGLGNLSFMSFQDGSALEVGDVIDPHRHVHAGCHEARPDGVEVEVQDLVGVSSEHGHALA